MPCPRNYNYALSIRSLAAWQVNGHLKEENYVNKYNIITEYNNNNNNNMFFLVLNIIAN